MASINEQMNYPPRKMEDERLERERLEELERKRTRQNDDRHDYVYLCWKGGSRHPEMLCRL